jgi:hypothetical protein
MFIACRSFFTPKLRRSSIAFACFGKGSAAGFRSSGAKTNTTVALASWLHHFAIAIIRTTPLLVFSAEPHQRRNAPMLPSCWVLPGAELTLPGQPLKAVLQFVLASALRYSSRLPHGSFGSGRKFTKSRPQL